jgi:serine/threonine protein kinase
MSGPAENEQATRPASTDERVPAERPGSVAPEDVTQSQLVSEQVTAKPEHRVGELLAGRYRLDRMVAKGGMGRVYLATQLPLGREVAVKVLTSKPNDDEFRQRFFLEASTCAKLVHRHIVTVHDYGEADDGELFMAMEYLAGEPLSRIISQQIRLGSERTAQIGLQICRALRTAHKTGIVHRDLKPGNVMLLRDEDQDGDFVKVLDFGLVKVFEDDETEGNMELTRSGTWLGSPRYMAPEQIRCKPVDPRTDVYSLGIIMFNMVAGRPPFVGANSVEILEQHLRDAPPTFADVVPDVVVAPELEVVIRRCMEKRPDDRYQSMDEVIADLKAAYRLMTGVSVQTESQLSTLGASHTSAPPDLSLPPDFSVPPGLTAPPDLSMPSEASVSVDLTMTPPPLPSSTPSPTPSDDMDVSFVQPRRSRRVWLVVPLLLLVGFVGYAATRALRPEPAKPIAVNTPAAPAPAEVEVRLTTSPAGATVRAEGRKIGETPLVHRVGADAIGQTKSFELELDGYEKQTLTTKVRERNVDLHAALVPLPAERVEPTRIEPTPTEKVEEAPPPRRRRSRTRTRSERSDRSERSEAPPPVAEITEPEAAPPPAVEAVPLGVDEGPGGLVVDEQNTHVVEEDSVPIVD